MGLGRMLWRTTTIGRAVDLIKNIYDEGNLMDGVKRTVKEDLCEDNPITSAIYNSGKYDGEIEGYVEASNEYEKKLISQANEFLKQVCIFESEKHAYEQLLDEYEKEINLLSEKGNRTEAENVYLQQLLMTDRKLRKMAS